MTTVYLAGAISGRSYAEAKRSFDEREELLLSLGYAVISPFTGIAHLEGEEVLLPAGYTGSASDREIYARARIGVKVADIVWVDFIGAKRVSIGSCFEIAWAREYGKKTIITTMEPDNIHRHAFINQSAIIFQDWDNVIVYLATKGAKK